MNSETSKKQEALAARRARVERELRLLEKRSTDPARPITEAEARRQKEVLLVRKHELDLAEREAGLIPADLVKQRWAAIATSVRTAVLAIPDRVAPLVAPCNTAIEARDVLAAECEQALRLIAAELRDGGGHGSPAHAHHGAPATHSATSGEAEKQEPQQSEPAKPAGEAARRAARATPRKTGGKARSKATPKPRKRKASKRTAESNGPADIDNG